MRQRWVCELLGVVGVLVLTSVPAAAQGYNTSTFVISNGNECRDLPACRSFPQPAVILPARATVTTRFVCPESHPNLLAWDVGLHEHVGVTLARIDFTSATIEGTNHADAEGRFVVSLGCSTSQAKGEAVLVIRRAAPTGWLGPVLKPTATSLPPAP